VTAPDPGRLLAIVPNERQRLRVVHDDDVMVEMIAGRIFESDLFVDVELQVRQIDIRALQSVVHLLRDAKEIGPALDDPPSGFDPGTVHQQSGGGQEFGHATAVIGRVDVSHVQVAKARRLLQDAFNGFGADQRLVILHRDQFEGRRMIQGDRHSQTPASVRRPMYLYA